VREILEATSGSPSRPRDRRGPPRRWSSDSWFDSYQASSSGARHRRGRCAQDAHAAYGDGAGSYDLEDLGLRLQDGAVDSLSVGEVASWSPTSAIPPR